MKRHVITLIMLVAGSLSWQTTGRAQEDHRTIAQAATPGPSAGHNAFAIDLFHQLGRESGNIFVSPLSIAQGLALAYAGAAGKTAQEIATVARFPVDRQQMHAEQRQLLAAYRPVAGGECDVPPTPSGGAVAAVAAAPELPYRMAFANRLWGPCESTFLPSFLQICRDVYGAPFVEVDFTRNPDQARQAINAWVAERTAHGIPTLVGPGDLDADTQLVLTNAIDFRAAWSSPFPAAATANGRFYLSTNEGIDTPMMHQRGRFAYADLPDLEVLQLPYRAAEVAFVVLLPKEREGLAALERSFDVDHLRQWCGALAEQELTIALPAFRLAARHELSAVLQAMGMVTAFDARADFSGMTAEGPLWIDAVFHEAHIAVSPEQTEAVAGSAVVMTKGHQGFAADRPFLFLIRDLRDGRILFVGRLADPRIRSPGHDA